MRILVLVVVLVWIMFVGVMLFYVVCLFEDVGLFEVCDGKFFIEIIVENWISCFIQLFWINYDGECVKYVEIGEGYEYVQ